MDILWIALIAYGCSVVLYAFRLCQKYFMFFENNLRNGTIITQAIGTAIIWPLTFLTEGIKGIWTELEPIKSEPAVQPPPQFDPTAPLPGLEGIVADAARENLTQPNRNPNPW